MDQVKFPLTRQDADLIGQALDVYATTLMCAPLGLGLDMLRSVQALRERLERDSARRDALAETQSDADSNVVAFARA